jgi:hypothetical protein
VLLSQVTPRLASASDRLRFAALVHQHVTGDYPGTEAAYGLSIFDEHLRSAGHSGYGSRRIWTAGEDADNVAYIVASGRPDGSIKLGPIVVSEHGRGTGMMLACVSALQESYRQGGVPYIYATHPTSNDAVRNLATNSGWNLAGTVRGLYRDDAESLIYQTFESNVRPVLRPSLASGRQQIHAAIKRGGSVRLKVGHLTRTSAIAAAGRHHALAVRGAGRVSFAKVPRSIAGEVDADQVVDLAFGNTLVIWR